MIEETATVVEVDGEHAWISGEAASACGVCAASGGCGVAVLGRWLGTRERRVRALNRAGARRGDRVVVGLEEGALAQGSLAVYLVPLFGLLAGGGLGEWLTGLTGVSEAPVLAGALLGLGAGLLWLRSFSRRIAHDPRFQPVVLRSQGARVAPLRPLHGQGRVRPPLA
jgi:sigma-E factor negative regulatory protein RseC